MSAIWTRSGLRGGCIRAVDERFEGRAVGKVGQVKRRSIIRAGSLLHHACITHAPSDRVDDVVCDIFSQKRVHSLP